MSTQKKVRITLTLCLLFTLILLAMMSFYFPYLVDTVREKMLLDEESKELVYWKRIENLWFISNLTWKALHFLYILWPILSSFAYKRGFLSKGFLAVNVLAPWMIALLAHLLPYLGIMAPLNVHLLMNVIPLTSGTIGSLLALTLLPVAKPLHANLS